MFRAYSILLPLVLAGCQFGPGPQSLPLPVDADAGSDRLQADPRLLEGRLSNGLRFAVLPAQTPAPGGALLFQIGTGSLGEMDAQRGYAHFLEHMAFNGSKGVPEGELIPRLEKLGLAFGPDINAFTDFDRTAYTLTLPDEKPATVDAALFMMREVAGNLTLDQDAINREKGVVLSEMRARNVPDLRMTAAQWQFLFPHTQLSARFPIGTEATINEANQNSVRAFYEKYYRPDNAVVVYVGHLPAANVIQRLEAPFSDWTAPEPSIPDAPLVSRKPATTDRAGYAYASYHDGNISPGISISVTSPIARNGDTISSRRSMLMDSLIDGIVTRRFRRTASGENPPFLRAVMSSAEIFNLAEIRTVTASIAHKQWNGALTSLNDQVRSLIKFGITPEELKLGLRILRRKKLDSIWSSSKNTQMFDAQRIGLAKARNLTFVDASEDLKMFDQLSPTITVEELNRHISRHWENGAYKVFFSSNKSEPQIEAGLAGAIARSNSGPVLRPETPTSSEFQYAASDHEGAIVSRTEIKDLGITKVVFENGVMLSLKPTRAKDSMVYVDVRLGRGMMGMPRESQGLAFLAQNSFLDGGLVRHDSSDISDLFADKTVIAGFAIDEDAFSIASTSPEVDLADALTLLKAHVTSPGYRQRGLDRFRRSIEAESSSWSSSPETVLSLQLPGILHNGDGRFAFPEPEALKKLTYTQLQQLLGPVFAGEPIEIGVTGNFDVEKAISAVAKTFGSLPARKPTRKPAGFEADLWKFPAAGSFFKLTHRGQKDQGLVAVYWPTADGEDILEVRRVSILKNILENRLVDRVREALGQTYSPSAVTRSSLVARNYGYIGVAMNIRPEQSAGILAIIDDIIGDLKSRPISADEFQRVIAPIIAQIEEEQNDGFYWNYAVARAQSRPDLLDQYRSKLSDYKSIKPADVQQVASKYLKRESRIAVEVVPQ